MSNNYGMGIVGGQLTTNQWVIDWSKYRPVENPCREIKMTRTVQDVESDLRATRSAISSIDGKVADENLDHAIRLNSFKASRRNLEQGLKSLENEKVTLQNSKRIGIARQLHLELCPTLTNPTIPCNVLFGSELRDCERKYYEMADALIAQATIIGVSVDKLVEATCVVGRINRKK